MDPQTHEYFSQQFQLWGTLKHIHAADRDKIILTVLRFEGIREPHSPKTKKYSLDNSLLAVLPHPLLYNPALPCKPPLKKGIVCRPLTVIRQQNMIQIPHFSVMK